MLQKDYFKGWYFKCSNENKTIAFIPAFHQSNHKKTASLQVITDDAVFNIHFQDLEYREKPLHIKIGECIFSEKGIKLNIHTKEITAKGTIKFFHISTIQYDIMGPFKFVPFMQCRHSVYSMRHRIDGQITVNGQQYVFRNGIGYMEGDYGSSFSQRIYLDAVSFQKWFADAVCCRYSLFRISFHWNYRRSFSKWERT